MTLSLKVGGGLGEITLLGAAKIVTKILQNPPPYYDVTFLAAPKTVISPRPPPTFSDSVTEYDGFFLEVVPYTGCPKKKGD